MFTDNKRVDILDDNPSKSENWCWHGKRRRALVGHGPRPGLLLPWPSLWKYLMKLYGREKTKKKTHVLSLCSHSKDLHIMLKSSYENCRLESTFRISQWKPDQWRQGNSITDPWEYLWHRNTELTNHPSRLCHGAVITNVSLISWRLPKWIQHRFSWPIGVGFFLLCGCMGRKVLNGKEDWATREATELKISDVRNL